MKQNITLSITTLSLISLTLLSAIISSSTIVSADDAVDEINIAVPVSCAIGDTGMNSHNAEINNGQSNSAIGETTIKAYCNDNEGFAIYATGYTNSEEGNNVLTNSVLGSSYDIVTGTATSGNNSNWAMKLSTITSPTPTYPIIIAGTSADTLKEQGDPDFSNFQEVPDDYTKVAYRTAGTDIGTNAEGSTLKTTYQAYISSTQPAGTYTGQVKYTLVHPHNAATPEIPVSIEDAFAKAGKQKYNGYYKMQDMSVSICSTVNTYEEDSKAQLIDTRDDQTYYVAKLLDDKCWMLDNLALDLTNSSILNSLSSANTDIDSNNESAILTSLKSGNRSAGNQYATSGLTDWTSGYSYSVPMVNLTNKDAVPTDAISTAGGYKVGGYYNYCAASAGSYCYGSGTSYGTSSGDATSSICPKGWRMPIIQQSYTAGGEYWDLYNNNYNTYDDFRAALHLPLSSYFYDGSVQNWSYAGLFWSSQRYGNYNMFGLSILTDNLTFNSSASRRNGYSIRCLFGD